MKAITRLMIAGALVFAFGQSGYAQAPAAPPAGGAAPTAPAAPQAQPAPKKKAMSHETAEMKAKAKECSKKATEQGLHGKARKEFREKCKKGEE
jgi:hypothetical protein